jgi:hypothetical protein
MWCTCWTRGHIHKYWNKNSLTSSAELPSKSSNVQSFPVSGSGSCTPTPQKSTPTSPGSKSNLDQDIGEQSVPNWQGTYLELRRAEADADAGGLRPGHVHPEPPPPARGRRRGGGAARAAVDERKREEARAGWRGGGQRGEEGGRPRAGDGQGHGARCSATRRHPLCARVWLWARWGKKKCL